MSFSSKNIFLILCSKTSKAAEYSNDSQTMLFGWKLQYLYLLHSDVFGLVRATREIRQGDQEDAKL